MNPKKLLSAIVIARNEEKRIAQCLALLSFADEIIVVDNGSADSTKLIARDHHATVIEVETDDFSRLRDMGAKLASGQWLLYVDADETVTPRLRTEIVNVIRENPVCNAYVIPRRNFYLGQPWPANDGMVRLIRKESLIRWTGAVHEHAEVKGETGRLKNHFIHNTHRTLAEMAAKTNEWSQVEARLRFDNRHPAVTWWRLIRVMVTGFHESFFRQQGWKAGTVGWIESIYQAFSMFITYAKLWELQRKNS